MAGGRAFDGISIHALLAESDFAETCGGRGAKYFYPRSPCGERRHQQDGRGIAHRFLSTLSLRRATLKAIAENTALADFYPRSPCGERHVCALCLRGRILFLSTLSLRRATVYHSGHLMLAELFLSTLSLRRATAGELFVIQSIDISIHALLAESDLLSSGLHGLGLLFLSTLSLRRATPPSPNSFSLNPISIHALLAESDSKMPQKTVSFL